MWIREQLKNKAKIALKENYWRVIFVTLIVFFIGGASLDVGYNVDSTDLEGLLQTGINFELGFIKSAGMLLGILIISAIIIGVFLTILVFHPLEVGTKRFFFKTLNQPAEVKEVLFAFDSNYKNVIKILFFRNLYIFGWSLLFVIPGIVKAYEYRLIPYLLAENPNLTKEQVFMLSKQMMTGNKWDTFVLELSFIGWEILSSFTLGILSVFYVEPYKNLTFAALYEELSLINGCPATGMQQAYYTERSPYEEEKEYI